VILFFVAAPGIDLGDAGDFAQFGFDDPVVDGAKFFE
jgi:hypothetical protein